MEQDPAKSLSKATGIGVGLPAWKEAIAEGLMAGIDGVLGAVGLGGDSKASQVGELIAAAAPILGATKALTIGKLATKGAAKPIRAYHGSPHDFDQFSLSKIGTGEGAQAYGHGLYFAEKEAVAKDYRNRLTDATADITEVLHRGQPLALNTPEAHAAKLLGDSGAPLRELRSWGQRTAQEAATGQNLGLEDIGRKAGMTGAEYYKRMSDFMQSANKRDIAVKRGRMYEVNINADPEDFLDWDAPLSQQSEKVRQAVERNDIRVPPSTKGRQIYDALASRALSGLEPSARPKTAHGQLPHVASEQLKGSGIPGIKYLDGASRSAGQGSRNYVVFDDSLISIVKKYGIAGAVSAGLINEAQAAQMRAQRLDVPDGPVPLSRLSTVKSR